MNLTAESLVTYKHSASSYTTHWVGLTLRLTPIIFPILHINPLCQKTTHRLSCIAWFSVSSISTGETLKCKHVNPGITSHHIALGVYLN